MLEVTTMSARLPAPVLLLPKCCVMYWKSMQNHVSESVKLHILWCLWTRFLFSAVHRLLSKGRGERGRGEGERGEGRGERGGEREGERRGEGREGRKGGGRGERGGREEGRKGGREEGRGRMGRASKGSVSRYLLPNPANLSPFHEIKIRNFFPLPVKADKIV